MAKVAELMDREPPVICKGETVQKAVKLMGETSSELVVVVDDYVKKKVVGVLTHFDIVNRMVAKEKDANIVVDEIMTNDIIAVSRTDSTIDVIDQLLRNKIKRVVVMDNGRLHGLVTSKDILRKVPNLKKSLLDIALSL